jgi:GMP synthase (glutamine-hydrolysing)
VQFHPEFSEQVMRHYIEKQRDDLAKQGQDADELLRAVTPSPAGRLLEWFGQWSTKRRGADETSNLDTSLGTG